MKIYNKISKSGIFCDKRVEHFTLVEFLKGDKAEEFEDYFSVDLTVRFYDAELAVEVTEFDDGIVRMFARVGSVEVGRLLVDSTNFKGIIKHLLSKKQEN